VWVDCGGWRVGSGRWMQQAFRQSRKGKVERGKVPVKFPLEASASDRHGIEFLQVFEGWPGAKRPVQSMGELHLCRYSISTRY
jgi:hypothetical protein